MIAHTTPTGSDVVEVRAGVEGGLCSEYLARIVEEIGDRERVVVLGPDAYKVQLERQYVAINGRPERLTDGSAAAETPAPDLLARLDELLEL
jgi:hypothetical protein